MPAIDLTARMYAHIETPDRHASFEDPLDAALRKRGLGKVTGGGCCFDLGGKIHYADLEIRVTSLKDALPVIVSSLEASGAPRDSDLTVRLADLAKHLRRRSRRGKALRRKPPQ